MNRIKMLSIQRILIFCGIIYFGEGVCVRAVAILTNILYQYYIDIDIDIDIVMDSFNLFIWVKHLLFFLLLLLFFSLSILFGLYNIRCTRMFQFD